MRWVSSAYFGWTVNTRLLSVQWSVFIYHSLSFIFDLQRARRSCDRIPVGARLSVPVQTGATSHPASCTVGTGFLSRGEAARCATLTTHWRWRAQTEGEQNWRQNWHYKWGGGNTIFYCQWILNYWAKYDKTQYLNNCDFLKVIIFVIMTSRTGRHWTQQWSCSEKGLGSVCQISVLL